MSDTDLVTVDVLAEALADLSKRIDDIREELRLELDELAQTARAGDQALVNGIGKQGDLILAQSIAINAINARLRMLEPL